jgi:hypothetical protein
VARTGTGCAFIEHRNRCVPCRQTPGDAETNTPAPMMATLSLLALSETRFGNRRLPSLE